MSIWTSIENVQSILKYIHDLYFHKTLLNIINEYILLIVSLFNTYLLRTFSGSGMRDAKKGKKEWDLYPRNSLFRGEEKNVRT